MVVGGRGSTGFLATSEVFDPATGRWAGLAKMQEARYLFACAALPDGRVVAGGGCNARTQHAPLASVEIYDPGDGPIGGCWSWLPDMSVGREAPAACALADGRVVVMGGRGGRSQSGSDGGRAYLQTVEVFVRSAPLPPVTNRRLTGRAAQSPETGRWESGSTIAPRLRSARYGGASVVLGGNVLLFGGADGYGEVNRGKLQRLAESFLKRSQRLIPSVGRSRQLGPVERRAGAGPRPFRARQRGGVDGAGTDG